MRYLSLFSGIEAASCAWQSLGWKLVGLSEIEKFPCNVLTKHYPKVPNLGDITKITGDGLSKLGHIDLIVGGSPCQGFSVAGKQEGLKDERSGLAKEYIRILSIVKPKWLVWENVPGVFSTNEGADFRSFIEEITEIGYGICWRVLDAQYFGVAQHRRRVFLIGYFGDWRPAYKVLFESQSLPQYLETLQRTKERITGGTEESTRKTVNCLIGDNKALTLESRRVLTTDGKSDCIAGGDKVFAPDGAIFKSPCNNVSYDIAHRNDVCRVYNGKTKTLEARMGTGGHNIPLVVGEGLTLTARQYKNQPIILDDQGGKFMNVSEDGKVGTLRAETCGYQPIVTEIYRISSYRSNAMKSEGSTARGIGWEEEQSPTLTGNAPAVCVQGFMIGRKDRNGPQGNGVNVEKSFTLNTTDRHAVSFHARVRKLTPIECLRLQGFPDDWLEGVKGYSDTAAYKAIGNSMAVPCMRWIGEMIERVNNAKVHRPF